MQGSDSKYVWLILIGCWWLIKWFRYVWYWLMIDSDCRFCLIDWFWLNDYGWLIMIRMNWLSLAEFDWWLVRIDGCFWLIWGWKGRVPTIQFDHDRLVIPIQVDSAETKDCREVCAFRIFQNGTIRLIPHNSLQTSVQCSSGYSRVFVHEVFQADTNRLAVGVAKRSWFAAPSSNIKLDVSWHWDHSICLYAIVTWAGDT